MCYHVEFGSSATKGLRINRREPPKFGSAGVPPPWARGVDDPHRNTPLTYTCYPAEFGRSMPNGASVIKDIHLKIWTLASRLSRSFKVIGSDADRSATYDFVLTFHSNHGPISYRFRDKRQLRRKVAKFPHTRVFCAPPHWRGSPWNWVPAALEVKKLQWWGYRAEKDEWMNEFCNGLPHLMRATYCLTSSAIN